MALPTTGITTTMVSQAIGLASNNVGELCIRAASGGVMTTTETPNFSSAFMVAEIGGTSGELVDGAKPYFNIFSTNSPSYWFKSGSTIKCKLKNIGYILEKNYSYSMGYFRGYNHAARPVTLDVGASYYSGESKIKFIGVIDTGDFNWSTVMSDQYGIIPSINVYTADGITKLATFYCGEAYSYGVSEYYFSGEFAGSQIATYLCKISFVALKADLTPGSTGYFLQENGWSTVSKSITSVLVAPSDVPTTVNFYPDVPEVTFSNINEYVGIDPNNANYSKITISFRCLDYSNLPIGERSKNVAVTVINPINSAVLYNNQSFSTHTITSTNTLTLVVPVQYTENNKRYDVYLG